MLTAKIALDSRATKPDTAGPSAEFGTVCCNLMIGAGAPSGGRALAASTLRHNRVTPERQVALTEADGSETCRRSFSCLDCSVRCWRGSGLLLGASQPASEPSPCPSLRSAPLGGGSPRRHGTGRKTRLN